MKHERKIMRALMRGWGNNEIIKRMKVNNRQIKEVADKHRIRRMRGNFPENLKPLRGKIIEKAIHEGKEVVV